MPEGSKECCGICRVRRSWKDSPAYGHGLRGIQVETILKIGRASILDSLHANGRRESGVLETGKDRNAAQSAARLHVGPLLAVIPATVQQQNGYQISLETPHDGCQLEKGAAIDVLVRPNDHVALFEGLHAGFGERQPSLLIRR
jgi:hypothetical protein